MSRGDTDTYEHDCNQALAWIARLNADDVADADRHAFALWLAEKATHRAAMDSMLELWDDLGSVRHLPFEPASAPAANQSSWWVLAAVAASLVLALLLWPLLDSGEAPLELQTALGEQRSFELTDTSRLTLNTNSRVLVAYDRDRRYLELSRGEAFFEVASDPKRPFEVDSGSALVTAIGTAFNIRRSAEFASITVTEGVVRVTELGVSGNRIAASEVVRANQRLEASSSGLEPATRVESDREMAWQRGELVAVEMRLPELAAELERYHELRILIADPEVAAMTVSGVFQLDQPEAILEALVLSHGLQIVRLNETTVRLLKPVQ